MGPKSTTLRVAELEAQLETLREECRKQEALQMEWTGNLGRWQWEVPTNQVTFNPWKVRALGYGEHEVTQPVGFEFFTALLHPEDQERVMENMRRHLFGQSDAYEVEYRIRAKEGDWRWYYDRGVISQRGPHGEALVVSGIVFDISPRKRLEAELRERNEELARLIASRTRFLSLLAHDLRGSLGGVVNLLDLIRDGCLDEGTPALDLAAESAHLTFELLENLLQWSTLQSGRLETFPTALGPVITASVALTAAQALAKGVEVSVEAEAPLVVNWSDEAGCTVLRNLVANAIKYTPPGRRIRVDVVDQGVDIEPGRLETLLEGMGSTPGTEGERGTGLGLCLCRELVERAGGSMTVTSVLGEGSRFTLRMPLVP